MELNPTQVKDRQFFHAKSFSRHFAANAGWPDGRFARPPVPPARRDPALLDRDDFGLNQSKIMNESRAGSGRKTSFHFSLSRSREL
jgi:hypothetical protein